VSMKKLIPLMLLATLVSCNENMMKRSTIINNNETVEKYEAGLIVQRGIVSNSQKAGTDLAMDFVNNKITTTKVSERSRSVIIHVDGDNVYSYVETTDNRTGSLSKKVVLDITNPQRELKELLNSNKGMLSNDTLILKGTNFGEKELQDTFKIVSAASYTSSFNLNKSHCESTNLVTTENRITNNAGEEIVINTQINETTSCGTKYTNKQLKEINLKSILYCSADDLDEADCTVSEDLSWLTSDII
jgi:hypothetical protein